MFICVRTNQKSSTKKNISKQSSILRNVFISSFSSHSYCLTLFFLKFAMKKINLEKSSNDEINSAKTEAKLLTGLQNEYILQVVTSYQESETLCIVTYFCDQGDLAQFLNGRNGKLLNEQQIVEWFRQICSALEVNAFYTFLFLPLIYVSLSHNWSCGFGMFYGFASPSCRGRS